MYHVYGLESMEREKKKKETPAKSASFLCDESYGYVLCSNPTTKGDFTTMPTSSFGKD